MARLKADGADRIYGVVQVFCSQALVTDGSMLSPGSRVWTADALDVLHKRFTENWDGSDASFEAKLEKQLQGAGDRAIQLMAELILIHLLVNSRIRGAAKRELLAKVLRWMESPSQIPDDISSALDFGLAWPGMYFNLGRDRQIRFLIAWMRSWKALDEQTRDRALSDPWIFKEQALSVDPHGGWLQRNAVLHMVFPDTFERIMLKADKEAVIKTFADRIGGLERAQSLDEDKALLEIREELSKEFGEDFDFYSTPEVEAQWRQRKEKQLGRGGDTVPLLDYVTMTYPGWTGFSDKRFLKDETDYKTAASQQAKELLGEAQLRELIDTGNFGEVVSRVEKVGQSTNLLWLQVPKDGDLSILYRQGLDIAEFCDKLLGLLHGGESSAERLEQFVAYTATRGLPGGWAFPTYLMMLVHPETEFFAKPMATKWLLKELGAAFDMGSKASGDTYEKLLEVVGDLRELLAPYKPESMMDVQSYVWVAYRAAQAGSRRAGTLGEGIAMVEKPSVYDHIAAQGFHFPDWLVTDYVLALATKPLVILSGISGTGKTKMAQLVSEHVAPAMEQETAVAPQMSVNLAGAVRTAVQRSAFEYRRLTIPAALVEGFTVPAASTATDFTVRAAGRSWDARLYVHPSGRNVQVHMKPELHDWFRANVQMGDYIEMRLVPRDSGLPDFELELKVVATERRVELVPSQRVAFLAVRPDWTDNRALLGYYNPLTQQYQATELLKLLLRAKVNPDEPHLVVLDEMNLAKVEYYFSDFLSAVEAECDLVLHDAGSDLVLDDLEGMSVPQRLRVPRNVFFTGTVNVDETTYMFSPKVLDRANTIEFNGVDLIDYGLEMSTTTTSGFRLRPGTQVTSLLSSYRKPTPEDWRQLPGDYADRIRSLHLLMAEFNLHFGYRVANEMARYLNLAAEHVGPESLDTAFDLQVLQKVLPKLSGSRAKLDEPLTALLAHLSDQELLFSAAKVERMLRTVRSVGFVSFVE